MKVIGRLRQTGSVPTYYAHERVFAGEVVDEIAPAIEVPPGPHEWPDTVKPGRIQIPLTALEWWVVLP